jgi:sulfite reductase (ferredoxin)
MTKKLSQETPGGTGGRDTEPGKILGIYPQKQEGLYMQRIKVIGGRLNWYQWKALADVAAAYCPGTALRVTTRQDIELHNIARRDLAVVQQGLAEAALKTFGAGGDSIRNVTVCPGCDFHPDGYDLLPMAMLVHQFIEQQPVVFKLPRKFKISFSGCRRACAKPWLNDLAFIAQPDARFTVVGAGSLGPKPALGIELYRDVPAEKILPLCIAAVEFFEQHGDRQNRRRARWRHVRERLGDEAFRAELDRRWQQVTARRSWPFVSVTQGRGDLKEQCRLQLPDGNITPNQVLSLIGAVEASGAIARIDLEHGIVLYSPEPVRIPEELTPMTKAPTIVACPGSSTCTRGLADCRTTAARIRETLAVRDLSGVRINISGCPNNCAQSGAAQIGLVGMIRMSGGKSISHYQLFSGGGNGTNDMPAKEGEIIPADEVPRAIEGLLKNSA